MTRVLAAVALALVALGIGLRFTNLDRKVFWKDETHTALWISGYDREAFYHEARARRGWFSVGDIERYRRVNPEGGVGATILYLAKNVPQHTPLFGVEARLYAERFGDSIAALRALPAIQSLFGFAAVFWLCRELFRSRAVAWVTLGLLAVSPYHLVFAQEARPYAQWTVTTILASAALLRALRVGTWRAWGLYALAAALGLYSFLLFASVLAGHALYVLAVEGLRPARAVLRFAAAAALAVAAFSPWLLLVLERAEVVRRTTMHTTGSLEGETSWLSRVLRMAGPAFVDFGDRPVWLGALVAALVIAALIALVRATPRRTWALVLALLLPLPLAFGALDLVQGGKRLLIARYHVPAYLAAVLAVGWLVGRELDDEPSEDGAAAPRAPWRPRAAAALGAALATAGVASGVTFVRADTWWTKHAPFGPELAAVVNREPMPLIVSGSLDLSMVVTLSYYLRPDTTFCFMARDGLGEESVRRIDGRGAAFVLTPPPGFTTWAERRGYAVAEVAPDAYRIARPHATTLPGAGRPAPGAAAPGGQR